MNNKKYLLTAPGTFQLCEADMTDLPSGNTVLLQIIYCGICGGDYSCYLGRRPGYPKTLGHEFVGKTLAIGEQVCSISVGDYVVSDLNYRCGTCDYCLKGESHLCTKNAVEMFTNRAFSQYMMIDGAYLYKIDLPPSLLYRAALVEPLSCVIHSCKQLLPLWGKSILINGCGGIGSLTCFYLKRIWRWDNIFVSDINKVKSNALAEILDVKAICFPEQERFDCVYESTNAPEGMETSMRAVKRGGKLCVMSHLYGEETSFIYEGICQKEIHSLFPLRNGPEANMVEAIKIITGCWTQELDKLLGIYPFEKLPDVFQKKAQLTKNKQIIQITKA